MSCFSSMTAGPSTEENSLLEFAASAFSAKRTSRSNRKHLENSRGSGSCHNRLAMSSPDILLSNGGLGLTQIGPFEATRARPPAEASFGSGSFHSHDRNRAQSQPAGLRDSNGGFHLIPALTSTTLNVLSWSRLSISSAARPLAWIAGKFIFGRVWGRPIGCHSFGWLRKIEEAAKGMEARPGSRVKNELPEGNRPPCRG